jgi:hypothetical protein
VISGPLRIGPEVPDSDRSAEPIVELAALLAAGYLRLLLSRAADRPTPEVCATCGREDSPLCAHEDLDVSATQRDQL